MRIAVKRSVEKDLDQGGREAQEEEGTRKLKQEEAGEVGLKGRMEIHLTSMDFERILKDLIREIVEVFEVVE